MKKVLKWIGIVIGSVFLLIGILVFWLFSSQQKHNKIAIPYIEETVPVISTWDANKSINYFSEEAQKSFSSEDFNKVMKFLSKMGELQSLGVPQFQTVSSSVTASNGKQVLVRYLVPAEYENGTAEITITLEYNNKRYRYYSFNLNSMALTE
ncbi:MAG: hypothetical protein ACRBBR_07480 [Cellvibrionaceae bacterium]